jgi:type 1 fimbria pilin
MIASERTQNIIVVAVIVTAIISSGLLVSNAQYYGGSYSLAGRLNVTLLEIQVRNIDHTNESVDPQIRLSFKMNTSSQYEGNVRITFIGASVTLNDDLLSYTSFALTPSDSRQIVTPDYNETFTMSNTATSYDKTTILDADTTGVWNWDIVYRYSFIVFDERGTITWRYVYFESTQTTII